MLSLIQMALLGKSYVENLFQREEGQDLFEYILIIAGISLIMVVAAVIVVPSLFDEVVQAMCEVLQSITGLGGISCPGGGGGT